MPSAIPLPGHRALLLALAVTGLIMGMVGMHHLAGTGPGHAPAPAGAPMAAGQDHGTAPVPDTSEGHPSALLHLCLAVLTVAGMLILPALVLLLTWGLAAAARPMTRLPWSGRAPRAPPRTAPDRLALLCVMRT